MVMFLRTGGKACGESLDGDANPTVLASQAVSSAKVPEFIARTPSVSEKDIELNGDVVFLTARPKSFRAKNMRMLARIGIHPSTILSGSLLHLTSLKKVFAWKFTGFLKVLCVYCVAVTDCKQEGRKFQGKREAIP